MKIAGESKSKQKDLYFKGKLTIFKTRAERLENKMAEKKQKESTLTLEKEKLAFQIEETGGFWSTEKQEKTYLAKCHTEKERQATLKTQLPYRLKFWDQVVVKIISFYEHRAKLEHEQNYWQI